MPGGYPQVGGAAGYPQAGGAAGYPQAYAGAAAAYGGGDPTQAPGGYYAPQPTQPGLPLPPQQQRYAYPALGAKGL